MSKKVRIHDLAKQYDMSGKDLAAKLRDLGFSQAKSHMSALDEFEVLQVQGILEAHGIISESKREDAVAPGGGLILRRKKKKKKAPEEAAVDAPTIEPTPEILDVTLTPAVEPAPQPPPIEEAPEPSEIEAAEPVVAEPAPEPAAASDIEPREAPAPAPEPKVVEIAPPTSEGVVAEPTVEPVLAQAEAVDAEPSAPAAEAVPAAEPAQPEPTEAGAKPKGTVVGFIDPASFQRSQPSRPKPESRRLQSSDDSAPEVKPTFSHDRRKALMRGAGAARGSLTAAQLREREQGRFLRRSRPGGPGGPGGRRGGPMRSGPRRVTESPLSGTAVAIEAPVTMTKLAEAIKLKANVVLKAALENGIGGLNINAVLDEETALLLAQEAFQIELKIVHEVAAEEALLDDLKKKRSAVEEDNLEARAPTVAFLGHVDHGKTTLIDQIRETRVADHEAGGITQHIGAYQVRTRKGNLVTIIDTPGHAAFTAMRARGAKSVDIVVLVVAGDDGVKPHTQEAVNHARAANTPVIVAITKKDKPQYNADRTIQQLMGLELTPEQYGGKTAMFQVSAVTGDGIQELLEQIALMGEIELDLKAHPEGPASGVVLEAEKQMGKGIVAHLLVQDGTLRNGDVILAGEGYGKVKSMHDDRGNQIEQAGPSTPVEVAGLDALPGVGDSFHVVESRAKAKEVAVERERNNRAVAMAAKRDPSANLESILGSAPKRTRESINLIVRADVQGSVEVLRHALGELVHDEVEVKVLNIGVGPITESDVDLAATSEALLIAFHVGVNGKARSAADRAGLEIRRYEVIYEMLDDLRDRMEGALAPEYSERVTGHVEIRRIFKSSRIGLIAGCYVLDGTASRDSKVRLMRDNQVVYTGSFASLRREADDAKEVREGFECGIVLKDFRDIKEGDVIETYKLVEVKRTLESTTKPG